MINQLKIFVVASFVLLVQADVLSQTFDVESTKALIESYKIDVRGPYRDIRWFCKDGSIRDPKDPCPTEIGPGVQHARYKETVITLAKKHQLYFGQILTSTDQGEFLDQKNNFSRLKQYQLEKYLKTVDNGWILRKGQFYRGAIQIEDEEAWGIEFFTWLLAKDDILKSHFFLVRQALKDIPHKGDNNVAQLIRSQSKVISDEFSYFMNLRVKIHSQPDEGDIAKVIEFKQKYKTKLSADLNKQLDELVVTMKTFYKAFDYKSLQQKSLKFKNSTIGLAFTEYVKKMNVETSEEAKMIETAMLLLEIRKEINKEKKTANRLELLDISLQLEDLIYKESSNWQPTTLQGILKKIYALGMANAGAGYIELWEWEQIKDVLSQTENESLSIGALMTILETARGEVEWSTAMVKANYEEIVHIFASFEPKSYGFIDDRIRGSVTLHLGKSVGELGFFIANESALTNKIMNLSNQSSVRGLNPGYAFGELVVVVGSSDDVEVNSNKIYVFERPPSDLKPVAGIFTVSEGNLVSHVQLLARNLGIPNAALSDENLNDLKQYNGQKVFYAVSNKGTVILKSESEMSNTERMLFDKQVRSEEKIEVPIEKIKLDKTNILNLRSVDAFDSGKLCGPKAANLGQLKKMFPENVVEGLVIPFGIFKDHMNQPMPGEFGTYWSFLNNMFATADRMMINEISEEEIELFQLGQLEILRKAIKEMKLKPEFVADLEKQFLAILGKPMGEVPVFLRSDTNMEDLKDFTGAGLNLTLFNVLAKEKILNGIKDVWASPYTERSFKWRQKYLLNPENVFPSILVIPSVNVDYSGVLITKGISNGSEKDLTIAFSRGAGGAVDGQSSESYLIYKDGGQLLLAPSRETYSNTLPLTGGTGKRISSFEKPILNESNLTDIRNVSETVRETIAKETKSDYKGAYDVELGFLNDKLWLFQIRPFVENKKALGSGYLESITPKVDQSKLISLSKTL